MWDFKMIKIKTQKVSFISVILAGILMSGCATTGMNNAQIEAAGGAALGGLVGGLVSKATGGSFATGALLGASAGGLAGFLHGRTVDMEEAEKLKQISTNAGQQSTIQTQVISDNKTNEKVTVFKSQEIKIKNTDLKNNNPKVDEILSLTESIGKKTTISQVEIVGDSSLIKSQVLPELSGINQDKIKILNQKSSVVTIKLTAAKVEQAKS